jgi:hypothetical protein
VRSVLVAGFCIAAAATTLGGAAAGPNDPALRVEIGYALATSDPDDADNELGDKYWDISPPVRVESDRRCERAMLTTRADTFFNGRPGFGNPDGVSFESELAGDGYRFEDRAEGPGDALPGETVRVTATARCFSGETVSTATATREFDLPTASCDAGPLRVGEVEGHVTAVDWDHEEQGQRALQPGFLVAPGSELMIEPGGHVEIGAPECNGFRVTLYEGRATIGSHARSARGGAFEAEKALAQGDAHAGGIAVSRRATIEPLGSRCHGCAATGPTSYEVRSTPTRVTLRVYDGAALIRGAEDGPALRVPAGHQASVLCSAGACRAGHVRLFQPNEPWSAPPEGIADHLPRTAEGAFPPLGSLAPPHAHVTAKRLPAAGGEPDRIVVAWSREVRRGDASFSGFTDEPQHGFLAWQRVGATRWELAYEDVLPCCPSQAIETGDLTGDGHLDALTREAQGSGGCGFTRVLIGSHGRLREEFAYQGCDYSVSIEKGAVVLRDGVGPCPVEGGAHCSGGTRTTVKRWNGTRLVTAREAVECHRPHLEPARLCTPRNTP